MKRLRLKRWVKVVLVIIFFIGAFTLLKKLDDDFMKSCIESGYSEYYCEGAK